jgi:hypothetical protein
VLEPRRSRYLRALGIDVYVPRFILPGAAESQLCAWDDSAADLAADATAAVVSSAEISAAETNVVETNSVETVVTEVAAAVRQRSVSADLDFEITPAARRVKANAEESGSVAIAPSTAAAVTPKFALSVVVSDCGILVVDDAPPNNGARSEYLRLLSNILLALRGQPAQPQLDVFLWPAVKHSHIDQSADAARETLTAYLHKQIQQHAIGTVLLLGDAAQQWCETAVTDNLYWRKSVSALACLQTPQNKRQLWQDIRHLAVAR